MTERFQAIRREVLQRERDPAALRQEVCAMRERMRAELDASAAKVFDLKQGRGGIADIEFMVQYQILANAHCYPDLLIFTDNIRQIDGLERFAVLSIANAARLRNAYRGLRRRIHRLTLQEQPAQISADEAREERESVIRVWRQLMEGA